MEGYYKIVELKRFNGKLKMKERSFRNLHRFEILLKVHATTISPLDLSFIRGEYGDIQPDLFPITPGFEGCGEIIKVGDDIDRNYVGCRCAVFADPDHPGTFEGLWAEFHYTTIPNVMIFTKDVPWEWISFIISPLTAVGMLDTIKKKDMHAVLQSGAASSVGLMFYKLCTQFGIQTINLVKDDSEYKLLKEIHTPNIIKANTDEWENELHKLCDTLKAHVGFDCVGGDMTGKILNLLPDGSHLYHFGNLMEKNVGKIKSSDIIFKDKCLSGWWFLSWLRSLSQQELNYWWNYIRDEIQNYSTTFETKISKQFIFADMNHALDYYTNHMNEGKVLIRTSLISS